MSEHLTDIEHAAERVVGWHDVAAIDLLAEILTELRRPIEWGGAGDIERLYWDPAATSPQLGPTAEYVYDGVFRSIGIFNLQPAAPTTSSIEGGGTANAPGAGATVASLTIPAAGLYKVVVTLELQGTAEAKPENAGLFLGAGQIGGPLATISAQTVTTVYESEQLAAGVLSVQALTAATAGSVYNATIVATALESTAGYTIRVALTPNASLRDRTTLFTLAPRGFIILPYRGTTVSVSGDVAGSALVVPFEVPQPANAGVF